MLKRRPSKRFVLAETGEESAWNTTTDNDPDKPTNSSAPNPVPPPQIEVGLIISASSSKNEDIIETPSETTVTLLAVPQPNLKSGMK